MKKYFIFAALALAAIAAAPPARAACAYTTVTGTITDPNGVPYSFANISADLQPAAGGPICSGDPFSGHIPGQADANGTFSMSIPPNASITPSSTHWQFTVSISPGVAYPFGKGPQSFVVSNVTISGASQSLTSTLSTPAPALTVTFGGGGGGTPCVTTALSFQFNNGGVFGCEPDLTFTAPHTINLASPGVLALAAGSSITGITATMLPAATNSALGIVQPDNVSLDIAASLLELKPTANNTVAGFSNAGAYVGYTGGSGITLASSQIACATSTASVFGCVKPDGTTITASGGVLTATASGGTVNNAAQFSSAYYSAAGSANTLSGAANGLTGQVYTSTNGAAPSYISAGLVDGNSGAAVTSTPYVVACDSGTALLDRTRVLRLQSGASVVTVPLSTATGCTGGMAFTLMDDGAGTVTVNRTTADTFSVFNGSTNSDAQTSFTLTNGQFATLNQGATGIWEVRITTGAATGANAALSNLSAVSINTSLLAQTGVDLGSTTAPFRNIFFFGSGTFGTTSLEFTGTPTAARTITFPDNTGTVGELNFAETWSAVQTFVAPVLGAFTATSGAFGTSPPSLTPGTGGAFAVTEGTQPSVGFGVGNDVEWFDSTGHCQHSNWNNVDVGCDATLASTQTFTKANTFSFAGAASTPGVTVSGAPFTGGSTTTNFPQFYVNAGAGPTTFSANGTEIGANSPSGFTGNFIDFHLNGGSSLFNVDSTGAVGAKFISSAGFIKGATIQSQTNCSSTASPAVCGSAPAGSVLIPTGTTSSTLTVNTSAVTANSQIFFYPDDTLGTKLSTTCNSTLATLIGGSAITARTAGTSFQITFNGTIVTNGVCGSYLIVN